MSLYKGKGNYYSEKHLIYLAEFFKKSAMTSLDTNLFSLSLKTISLEMTKKAFHNKGLC